MDEFKQAQISQLRHIVRELGELAENATLTGALGDGAPHAVRRYNTALAKLQELGALPQGMFEQLPASATLSDLSIDAHLVVSTLADHDRQSQRGPWERGRDRHRGDREHGRHDDRGRGRRGEGPLEDAHMLIRLAPFVKQEDLGRLVKNSLTTGRYIDPHTMTALAPFLDSGTLSDLMHRYFEAESQPSAPEAPEPPSAPAPPSSTEMVAVPEPEDAPDTLEDLAERLRDPHLSNAERQEIAIKLAELAHSQATVEDAPPPLPY